MNSIEKDLLTRMLEKDPSKRISSKDCLDHPYFSIKENDKDAKFPSEDFNCIESELDLSQQNNISKYAL